MEFCIALQYIDPLTSPPLPLLQVVLVGDRVRLTNINWRVGQGFVDDVLERSSELQYPAVANVDHILLLFALQFPPVSASA